jgi:predicted nuclease of predicted toxin-antitoxin system
VELVLDDSVDLRIEKHLKKNEINIFRPKKGVRDKEVISHAIERDSPLVTRDQSDFIRLGNELEHPGIYIDKNMHRRDPEIVANTIIEILQNSGQYRNQVIFISNFYGI